MDKLLKLLDTNARMSNAELAVVLGSTEEAVAARIAELERSGVIRSYKAVIDWERTDRPYVTALIELRVTPKRDLGFEGIAEQVMQFDEVESVYLMSGRLRPVGERDRPHLQRGGDVCRQAAFHSGFGGFHRDPLCSPAV